MGEVVYKSQEHHCLWNQIDRVPIQGQWSFLAPGELIFLICKMRIIPIAHSAPRHNPGLDKCQSLSLHVNTRYTAFSKRYLLVSLCATKFPSGV